MISIHALREEGDDFYIVLTDQSDDISIHALREEGDRVKRPPLQSIHHFYPRPPRGGRQHNLPTRAEKLAISIHALREEGDPRCVSWTQR